jgi:hypothetical protein
LLAALRSAGVAVSPVVTVAAIAGAAAVAVSPISLNESFAPSAAIPSFSPRSAHARAPGSKILTNAASRVRNLRRSSAPAAIASGAAGAGDAPSRFATRPIAPDVAVADAHVARASAQPAARVAIDSIARRLASQSDDSNAATVDDVDALDRARANARDSRRGDRRRSTANEGDDAARRIEFIDGSGQK